MALTAGQGLFNGPQPLILKVNAVNMVPVYGRPVLPKITLAQERKCND
jgi:hypothetical protein